MRPDNVVTANPLLLDPLLVATLLAATPSSAPAESWIVASPFALVAMEPACTPHVWPAALKDAQDSRKLFPQKFQQCASLNHLPIFPLPQIINLAQMPRKQLCANAACYRKKTSSPLFLSTILIYPPLKAALPNYFCLNALVSRLLLKLLIKFPCFVQFSWVQFSTFRLLIPEKICSLA